MQEDPMYLLEKGARWAMRDADHPAVFDFPLFEYDRAHRAREALFSLGPASAGAYFHAHTAAWNGLVYGRKRWFLFPPLSVPYGPESGLSMPQWVREVYDKPGALRVRPLECVQQAGEVMFVPAEWHHGILNLEDSVGVAVQMGHFDMNDHPSPIFARGYLDLRAQAQAASAGGTEAPPAAGKAAKAKRKKKKTKGRKAKAKAQPKMKTKKAAQ